MPPSYTTISPSGRSGREGTQSTTSTRPGTRSRPAGSPTAARSTCLQRAGWRNADSSRCPLGSGRTSLSGGTMRW
jgi:hypothetical protein